VRRTREDVEMSTEKLRKFLSRDRTLDEIQDFLSCRRSTAYRRLQDLEGQGFAVIRLGSRRPSQYCIFPN